MYRAYNAAFTLSSFDEQERILTFVKTDFQVLKRKFHACSFKQAFCSLQKLLQLTAAIFSLPQVLSLFRNIGNLSF